MGRGHTTSARRRQPRHVFQDKDVPVVCVDVAPRAFDALLDKEAVSVEVVTPDVVLMVYHAAALEDTRVLEKGAKFFAVFAGTSSGLRFGFFYSDERDVDKSLIAALTRCMQTQTDRRLTTREDRWGDLDVPFCNLKADNATERPADEVMHAGATLLAPIACAAGNVVDCVFTDGQTAAAVVGAGVLRVKNVGALLARTISDGTCVAIYCREDVHPCDTASVFCRALQALAAWTWRKPLVALPQVPDAPAPRKRQKKAKKVHNTETPEVVDYIFSTFEAPSTRGTAHVTAWAEPPELKVKEDVPVMHEQRSATWLFRSAQWLKDAWTYTETTTESTSTNLGQLKTQQWQHPHYRESFSLNEMQSTRLRLDRETQEFAHKGYHPARVDCLGRDALFCFVGSRACYTRAQVRSYIKAKQDARYAAAGFTRALVDDDLHFSEGSEMPKTEEWSHATFEPHKTFARDEMNGALERMREPPPPATPPEPDEAQQAGQRATQLFWQRTSLL